MKKTLTLLVLGALTLSLLAFGFVNAQAKSDEGALLQATATPSTSGDDGSSDTGLNTSTASSTNLYSSTNVALHDKDGRSESKRRTSLQGQESQDKATQANNNPGTSLEKTKSSVVRSLVGETVNQKKVREE